MSLSLQGLEHIEVDYQSEIAQLKENLMSILKVKVSFTSWSFRDIKARPR